jgi:hypothetical protein
MGENGAAYMFKGIGGLCKFAGKIPPPTGKMALFPVDTH